MKRKAFAALAAVCLVLCLILAGCGTVSEEDYPPLEKVDLSSMTLGTVSNSTFSTQYPADKWTGSDGTSPLIIYYNDTQGTGQAVNINAQQSGTYSGKFTEKYMNKLTESITESFPNIEILNARASLDQRQECDLHRNGHALQRRDARPSSRAGRHHAGRR